MWRENTDTHTWATNLRHMTDATLGCLPTGESPDTQQPKHIGNNQTATAWTRTLIHRHKVMVRGPKGNTKYNMLFSRMAD